MKRLITTAFLFILTAKTFAQTAVPFLQFPPDARHSAMGGMGVATSADASANFYNPAKLAFSDRTYGGNATRFSWLRSLVDGMYATNISGYYKPKSGNQAIGVYYRTFNQGTINFTTVSGQPNGTFSSLDQAAGINYARKIANNISLGIGLKYINSNLIGDKVVNGIATKPARTVAGDIGVFGMMGRKDNFRLNYGLSITNIGGRISYGQDAFSLPTNIRVGIAPTFRKNKNSVLVGFDVNKNFSNPFSNPLIYSVGTEYSYNNYVFGRAGYFYGNSSFVNYFSVGLGGRIFKQIGIDFAYRIGEGSVYNKTAQFSIVFDIEGFDKKTVRML